MGEVEYIEEVLRELYREGVAIDGDAWIIGDSFESYGYGHGGVSISPWGSKIYGGRVLHTPSNLSVGDPVRVYKNRPCLDARERCSDGYSVDNLC
jgi:hypothetical protein